MIITIDGPAGAGKSSVARQLAQRLGFRFLDTGAMYRAVAWAVLQSGVDPHDEGALQQLLQSLELHLEDSSVVLNGTDISDLDSRSPGDSGRASDCRQPGRTAVGVGAATALGFAGGHGHRGSGPGDGGLSAGGMQDFSHGFTWGACGPATSRIAASRGNGFAIGGPGTAKPA